MTSQVYFKKILGYKNIKTINMCCSSKSIKIYELRKFLKITRG